MSKELGGLFNPGHNNRQARLRSEAWKANENERNMRITVETLMSLQDKSSHPETLWLAMLGQEAYSFPALELVAYRINPNTGGMEIPLKPRGPKDPFWPGEEHSYGTMVKGKDKSLQETYQRLEASEIGKIAKGRPELVGNIQFDKKAARRGGEVALVYVVEADGEVEGGHWFDVEDVLSGKNLPDGFKLVPHHYPIIEAVTRYVYGDPDPSLTTL